MAVAAVDGASSIQVTVRVRPFTIREAAQLTKTDDSPLFLGDGSLAAPSAPKLAGRGLRTVIKVVDDKCLVFDPPEDSPVQRFSRAVMPTGKRVKDQTFGFDRVFDENTTQNDVYEASTKPLLDSVLDGYNATVFAYGATGCGKTHTITGTAQQPGIIFMTMQDLFEKVGELKGEKESEITLSYLEIYNETIRDLLTPAPAGVKQSLMLREDSQQVVSVAGLTSHKPQNVAEVMEMVLRGNEKRTQSPTEANATSSRSHAVLQVNVSLRDRNASTTEPVTMATLSIIDLAGSERASATKNRGERLLEGANINKSLLALGSCINALCDPRKKNHVPYRNSKLTRLLKFSLGGNCRTVMIVCVSPSSQHYDETQNTLRYANRAKNIQTKSVRNVYNVDRHVKDYLKKIDEQMNRINELTAQQKQHEELAFAKFRKADAKRSEIMQDGIARLRTAFEHTAAQRKERINSMRRLRLIERRISAISGWIGAFDQVCENRDEEEPPASLASFRQTATGILVELENSRQHYHQRLAKDNWTRAIDTALQDSLRNLDAAGSVPIDSAAASNLQKECELLKASADVEAQSAFLEQEKLGDSGLMHIVLTSLFEVVAILNQLLQMPPEEAERAAKQVLGKLLVACTEATGQVVKPDGGLQIREAVPPTRSGTPKKRKQATLQGPSPVKGKVRASIPSASVLPAHVFADVPDSSPAEVSSPARSSAASPRRRVRLGGLRKGVAFNTGTPRKKAGAKKAAVRWRDDAEEGDLVEFQPTPEQLEATPDPSISFEVSAPSTSASEFALGVEEVESSPLLAPPVPTSELRKAGTGRFAAGFLSKKASDSPNMPPPPMLSINAMASSSEDDTGPLREVASNSNARKSHPIVKRGGDGQGSDAENDESMLSNHSATSDKGFAATKKDAQQIREAMKVKRTSSTSRQASRPSDAIASHRRRSPSATSPPQPSSEGIFSASHARRMVRSEKEDPQRSVLSPRTAPVTKATGPVPVRRSMFEASSSAGSMAPPPRQHVRVSSITPSQRTSTGRAVWR